MSSQYSNVCCLLYFAPFSPKSTLHIFEALKASGANKTKTLVFAVIPQILPSFLSLILYRFELNLRSASILGLIGVGGIGTPLIFALQTRSWDRVGIILIGLVIMVAIVDFISGAIRKRIV